VTVNVDRRRFLVAVAASSAGAVAGFPKVAPLAGAMTTTTGTGGTGSDPVPVFGPLGEPDATGLRLPDGFTGRVVARSGEAVEGSAYQWHAAPDGGATFPTDGGGWVYVSNSETGFGDGGVGAIKFDADGQIVDAYRILDGTARNCAGGHTPWGTWLSCEEFDVFGDQGRIDEAGGYTGGRVWECDPQQPGQGEARDALGVFVHEAVAVDPDDERLYLTEDHGVGRFYRFTPDTYPSLDAGALEVMQVDEDGGVSWLAVPDPLAETAPTRDQVPDSTAFNGGEGLWYRDGHVYFTTKGDDHVWDLDVAAQKLFVLYDGSADQPLHGVDNITAPPAAARDLYVAEDGDDLQVVVLTEEGPLEVFLQCVGPLHEGSELCGPAFTPDGTRFYISSQRGGEAGVGITYEITGPFRTQTPATQSTTTTAAPATASPELIESGDDGDDGPPVALFAGAAVAGFAAATGASIVLRNRRGAAAGGRGNGGGPSDDAPA
jgi:secreted PhoX family phosphatase